MDREQTEKDKSETSTVSRRSFLKLLIAGVAAAAGVVSLNFLRPKPIEPELTTVIPTTAKVTPSTFSTTPSSKGASVVVVRGSPSVKPALLVEKALESLGGAEKIVPSGASIFVKPNVGFYDKEAATDPAVVVAAVNCLKRASPSRIVAGESSVRGNDTEHALQVTGMRSIVGEAGVEVKDLRKDQEVNVSVPKGKAMSSVNVFKIVRDSSFIVDIPRLKRHSATTTTISLKNMMGTVPDSEKGRFHQVNLNQCIADLNSVMRPSLVIIDATRVMTKRGPTGGIMVELNTVMASLDPVAADLVAAEELFKAEGATDPTASAGRVEHIRMAAELGVGVADRSKIEVMEVKVS